MYQYNDPELGKIIVKRHARAKRVIVRHKDGTLQMTIPQWLTLKQIPAIIDEMRAGLVQLIPDQSIRLTHESKVKTLTFTTQLQFTHLVGVAKMQLKEGVLTIFLPENRAIESAESQSTIKKMIVEAMRHEAKRVLIPRTKQLAEYHQLTVNSVRISRSVGRWGSCSSLKNINLSLFLMLLPQRYIDYVILHELAHTVEMNHSDRFWKLLSKLCGEDAKKLAREVRSYKSFEKQLLMKS